MSDSFVGRKIKCQPGNTGLITRVPLPISSSSVPPSLAPAPLLYFAKFAERDADNDGAASGAEGTEMSHSTERLG